MRTRRGQAPLPALVKIFGTSDPNTRLGTCSALAQLQVKAAHAIPVLRNLLDARPPWLRIKSMQALAANRDTVVVAKSAQSEVLFAAGIRIAGLTVLAKHRIMQRMNRANAVMEPNKWGKGSRITRCLKVLEPTVWPQILAPSALRVGQADRCC